jgi:hypothetical protein
MPIYKYPEYGNDFFLKSINEGKLPLFPVVPY